jgi:formylglycine-generating enzyme required for sulfatase activity
MKFVPVPDTEVLFCVWKTRVEDFAAFVDATKYEATQGMYTSLPDRQKRLGSTWKNPGFPQGPTNPVCGVSWEDARAFNSWLTKKEQAEGRLLATQRYRLPTDREWSVAVGLDKETGVRPGDRDGQVSDVYPWGKIWPPPPKSGNYGSILNVEDGYGRTSPVGSYPPNAFGLFDLGSNLREWCADYYTDEYHIGRVLRGASWNDSVPRGLLSSMRFEANPGRRVDVFGFRCVLVVESAEQATKTSSSK